MKRARVGDGKAKKRMKVLLVSLFAVCAIAVLMLGFHSVLFPMSGGIDGTYVMPVDKATGKANVLLLGVDKDGMRTDTIIIASYDLDNDKVNMLSIPRDTRMYIGKSWQKINAAYSLRKNGEMNGVHGTIEAVSRLTGIPINYYVVFSCEAFRNAIDALDGIEFDVPRRMYYTDPAQDLYIDLQPGLQVLDGNKAEQLVRFRKYPGGDIDRVKMQQQFVKALAEQKLNLSIIGKLPDLFKVIKNDIKTNFTVAEVGKYIPNLKELSSENIIMYQLPGNFSGDEYRASYWLANIDEIKTLVETQFGYDASGIMTGTKGKTDPGGDKKTDTSNTNSKKESNNKTESSPKPTSSPKATSTPKSTSMPEPENMKEETSTPKPVATPATQSGVSDATPKPTKKPGSTGNEDIKTESEGSKTEVIQLD
ncbi:MAG: LCP family protein [Eubacteriales bacterium]|nr:LCP family protein [Eubacteriales bacterium]